MGRCAQQAVFRSRRRMVPVSRSPRSG
jgi:hypothetical protein